MNFLSLLTIIFVIFPSFVVATIFYNTTISAYLSPKITKQIQEQTALFQENPINFDLKTAHLFANPPQQIKAEKFTLPLRSSIAVDLSSNLQLFGQVADQPVAIASITKLMTALVWLKHNPGWKTEYEIKPEDRRTGGRIRLYNGDHLTAKDLFYASLIASENTAIIGLVNLSGLSESEFVAQMNQEAKKLKMYHTQFVDPTGLDPGNVSTARDVFKLARVALLNKDIQQAVATKEYRCYTQEKKQKIFPSTDELLGKMPPGVMILGGKTGYLEEGGYSFVGLFEKDGHKIISVALGASNRWQRFIQTKKLLEWIFQNYVWIK